METKNCKVYCFIHKTEIIAHSSFETIKWCIKILHFYLCNRQQVYPTVFLKMSDFYPRTLDAVFTDHAQSQGMTLIPHFAVSVLKSFIITILYLIHTLHTMCMLRPIWIQDTQNMESNAHALYLYNCTANTLTCEWA